MKRFQEEKKETELLLNNIPAITVALFVVSVVCMNLLANLLQKHLHFLP